jgi:hypothetical protein
MKEEVIMNIITDSMFAHSITLAADRPAECVDHMYWAPLWSRVGATT